MAATGNAVFSMAMAGAAMAVTVAVDGPEVTAEPVGEMAVAVAVLVTPPASTSAWVMAYTLVQVVVVCGARVVAGQVIGVGVPVPVKAVVVILMPVSVVLPVLKIR
ncbi:hypothetical protein GCM10017559_60180 [Streptosporangium longisporum]|uniref:Secreted peptide n=1 Tax=Streptosporangium longisporum TaxID=46187 RepID=A0ABP6L0D4_9ACTN